MRKLQDLLELTPQKDVLFIIGDWNAKVGGQEIPGITGKLGLGVHNEAEHIKQPIHYLVDLSNILIFAFF